MSFIVLSALVALLDALVALVEAESEDSSADAVDSDDSLAAADELESFPDALDALPELPAHAVSPQTARHAASANAQSFLTPVPFPRMCQWGQGRLTHVSVGTGPVDTFASRPCPLFCF